MPVHRSALHKIARVLLSFAAVSFTASSIYPLIRPLSFFMSSQRLLCILSSHYSSSYPARLTTRSLFFIRFPAACTVIQLRYHRFASWISSSAMPNYQRKGGQREQRWIEKPKSDRAASSVEGSSAPVAEASTSRLGGLSISDNCCQEHGRIPPVQFGSIEVPSQITAQSQKAIWKPKCIGTVNGSVKPESRPVDKAAAEIKRNGAGNSVFGKSGNEPSKELMDSLLADFSVDNSTYSRAEIRATFYPKFENEKSDQEVRARMIEMVSKGIAALEVTLKHSGSLFMYAGHQGGAYAKNSYGNIYTAVGVFVLARTFCKAWGTQAAVKQAEFNEFLEENRMCISMELVTAVLGDHGQRPHEDYVVITAVTELGYGRPNFYSTADVITFCRKWRLPTNHVWLFSTRKSVTSFFAAYDALCEEGTATPICRSLDDVADISVPGSIDHIKVQGEILEGLVARIVSHESSEHMEKILRDFSPPPSDGAALDLGPSLREVCAANRSNEKQQIKSVLKNVGPSFCPNYIDWFGNDAGDINSGNADQSDQKKRSVDRSVLTKFLQAHPVDHSTVKLQEMARLIREKHYRTDFKCYYNFHKINSFSRSNLYFKMVIHVRSDSAFRRYQKEMRFKPGLWPLYRGFFVDINLFKENKEKAAEMARHFNSVVESVNGSNGPSENDLADEDANLMIKLKFLTYKLRTFLIRNGLSILFTDGPAAYKAYYMRQMNIWNTSAVKQRGLSKMLDEWANYIRRKCGSNKLSSSTYLSEAEPFLEQYAKRSQENQALIGSAGNFVRAEDFMAIVEAGRDEEGDLQTEWEVASSSRSPLVKDPIHKDEGLIIFFPGIPGCAKSALCKELLSSRGVFGDDKCVHSLMGDLIKGRYWQKVADEYKRKPSSVLLADKNAPNEEVWRQIEDMCRTARAHAVPIVPDSEGTDSNPFSHDALAVFIFRVLQRVNHPGNLDKASPNVGYVLLMFYHLYEGKNRKEFEGELIERFGSLVKMPLLKFDRRPLPAPMNSTLEEGINLYRLHTSRHGRLDSTKGSYAKDWSKWEKQLRKVLFDNAEYLSSIQVPFEFAVAQVLEQLQTIAKGGYTTPSTEKRKFGSIVFAAVSLPVAEIKSLLENVAQMNSEVEAFVKNKNLETLQKAHVTLAHKRSHGVTAVANYGQFLHHQVNVAVTALLFSEKVAAAFEVCLGSVGGGGIISSRNEWPHVTLWTAEGVAPKEANALPNLTREGKAARVIIDPPVSISGPLEFF